MSEEILESIGKSGRALSIGESGDPDLGPFRDLPGVWTNLPHLDGRGWNMIALPFISNDSDIAYRVLMNQYNEVLKFEVVDKGVPNRGVIRKEDKNLTQRVVTLDYEQFIKQKAADDKPVSGEAGGADLPIHHEPGLWLHMLNLETNNSNIARLASIPHGNSALAMGTHDSLNGPPTIPSVNVLPIGATQNINSKYLEPYKHFHDHPFLNIFDVLDPHGLLAKATPANVVNTTVLKVNTKFETGGIVNIPFIVKHAESTEMESTIWIMETSDKDENGDPVFIMQYMQIVMQEFFDRFDNQPGLIKWPHVSFNTLRRSSSSGQINITEALAF